MQSPQPLRMVGVQWRRRRKPTHRQKSTHRRHPRSAAAQGRATPSQSTLTALATRSSISAPPSMPRKDLIRLGMLLQTSQMIPGPLRCKPPKVAAGKTGVQHSTPLSHLRAAQPGARYYSATRFSTTRGARGAWGCPVKKEGPRPRWTILSNLVHSLPCTRRRLIRLNFLTPAAAYLIQANNHSIRIFPAHISLATRPTLAAQ